ncbi:MAG: hypothetical protein OXI63_12925, partial [Candidatus Poribacteria bacterium]|nr:hypothetical protein [Candidatus Poribacteria bacterium]
MKQKRLAKKRWLFPLCAVTLLVVTLFLYRRSFNGNTVAPVTIEQTRTQKATRNSGPSMNSKRPIRVPQQAAPTLAEEPAEEAEKIAQALDFLEKLQEGTGTVQTSDKTQTAENTTEFTQEELSQLIREGVAYYDSLVDSGSVAFYLQMSSVDYPGIPRMPSGTYEGTFEFSGGRIRADVTRNITQYDERFGSLQYSDTKQFAYDGETFENLEETRRGQRITRRSDVVADASIDPRAWGWGSEDGERGLIDVINRLENPYIEPVNLDGIEVYQVKGTLQDIVEVELWLNPEESYRPMRHTFFTTNSNDTTTFVTRDYTYQEVAPDLWFPKSGEEVVTLTDLKTGRETDLRTRTMQFS